ncbi:MAG: hypothetical protein ACPG4Z_02420 [Chitinophagales bacterium]
MKKILIVLFLILGYNGFSQNDESSTKPLKYKISYRLPLTSWLDFTSPSINFGMETMLSSKWALYQEIGYINDNFNPAYDELYPRDYHGVKAMFEPRYYINFHKENSIFITPSFFYKYYGEKRENEEFARFGGMYFQEFDFTKHHHMFSFTPRFGLVSIKDKNKIGFELTAGMGIRVLHIPRGNQLPDDVFIHNAVDDVWTGNLINEKEFGTYVRPNLFIRLSLFFVKRSSKAKND